ncbi:hypothetical protein D6783_05420 [Candidatus Woesearchaeota archaeon]|nr:MAG: hypothetical protein D6783_05420 [Candidatus Woesearchaeota archaeon]
MLPRNNKKAEMGMGTLIIFIAMILVAAVAAGVLIQTTGSLQNKALATGKATKQEVGTSINALELFAEDGTDQSVDYLYMTVKLSGGSDPIRFTDTLLTLNLDNTSADYEYNASIDCSNTGSMSAGGDFGISYQITGTNNKAGYLTKGDVVKICFQSPRSIGEGEDLKVNLVPMVGTPLVVEAAIPDLIVDKRIAVYP